MDQRPSSAKSSLGVVGRRSTLNTEERAQKRGSFDETRLKKHLELPETDGYKASSLPRGTKIGNSSTASPVPENVDSHRKADGNGKH